MKSISNFKFQILNLLKHPLFSGSAIMVFGSNFGNFFAYVYHLVVGRKLGPAGYGELASIINLVGLFAITFGFLGMVIVKFVSASKKADLPAFFGWIQKRTLIAAGVLSLVVFLATPPIARFLNASYLPVALAGPILFVYFVGYIYRSFLQGLLRFGRVVIVSNLDLFGRFVLGVLFVTLGLSVFGAVLGILIASLLSLFLTFYFLREFNRKTGKERPFLGGGQVWAYSFPVLLMSISTNSMYMTDVILAKHFFDPQLSGIYASLSTLGKIIFYGTAPIIAVMFPLVSQRKAVGGNYRKVFYFSLVLTLAACLGVLALYALFPALVIGILYGNKFLGGEQYLVWFGVFMTIFTLASLILNYFMSIGETRPVYFAMIAAILQVVGIYLFHSSITDIIAVSIAVSLSLLGFLVIYLIYETYFRKAALGYNSRLPG